MTNIGYGAFCGCDSLTKLTIGNGVTTIEGEAFSGCIGLTEITIPDSVTYIGDRAFYGCISLTDIVIPENVTNIEGDAFSWCTNLKNITISNSMTDIGECAFDNCENLESIFIKGYSIHGDFGKIYHLTEKLQKALSMLENQDFSAELDNEMKYPVILAYYRKTKNTKALINEFEKIVTYVIQQNDIAVIESLIAVDNLFTKKNIDKLIQTAIDNQKHEIYVILLNYKAEKLGFKDIKEQFKL